jgi:HAD superfamily hydrolase (TIGR01509 family)
VVPDSVHAVLWDLDGVIVDSGKFHFAAYRRLFGEMGIEITEERFFSAMFGRRNWDIIRDVLGDLAEEEVHRLAAKKEAMFRDLVAGNIEALPGSMALLRRAHEGGLKQSIVSSTPRENIALIVRTLDIDGYLDAVVGEEDSERGKPDPQPFTTAADRLRVACSACVVIEDAPEGIEGGKAAGMRCLGVATTRPPQRLRAAGADEVVQSLEDGRAWAFVSGR